MGELEDGVRSRFEESGLIFVGDEQVKITVVEKEHTRRVTGALRKSLQRLKLAAFVIVSVLCLFSMAVCSKDEVT